MLKSASLFQNIIKLSPHKTKSLIFRQSYNFLSPIDKPVLSLALTSFHQMSAQIMTYSFIQSSGSIGPQFSILLGAIVFRFGVQGICSVIRLFKYKNKQNLETRNYIDQRYHQNDRSLVKAIDKVFVLDSVRDLQFYGVCRQDINRTMWQYYRPGVLIASAANIYLCLNFLRGAHLIVSDPNYLQFCQATTYLSNLLLHDTRYITPIFIILLNFAILKRSRHLLLININHPGNLMNCFNIAFMGGLIFVPIPGIYHFAYMGLAIGHLIIITSKYFKQDIDRGVRKLLK